MKFPLQYNQVIIDITNLTLKRTLTANKFNETTDGNIT